MKQSGNCHVSSHEVILLHRKKITKVIMYKYLYFFLSHSLVVS